MKMRKGQDTIDIPEADVSAFVRQGFVPFIADTQPMLRTPASQVRAAQVAPSTGSRAVDFFERGRRTRAQGMPDIDVGGFVDRTLAALHPDVSPDKTVTQNTTSAILNALSAPGRAVAATPSLFGMGPDKSYLDAFARRGAHPDQGMFAGFVEDVARDPANIPMALLAGPSGVAEKAIIGRLGTKILPKILAKVAEAEVGAGLPMALTGAARQYADDADDYASAVTAPVVLAPAGEAALRGGKAGLARGGKAVMSILDKIKTPGYKPLDQITIDAAAAGEAQPMDRTIGLLTHPTLGGVVRDVRQSISDWLASDAVRNPAATTAKSMLRGMVKPAPMVRKQAESRDWDAALAGPEGTKLFDQLTSYLDVGLTRDATANMASRNLAHIDEANRRTWEPLLGAAKSSVRDYEDAVAAARATSDPEIDALINAEFEPYADPTAATKIGVDPRLVLDRAKQLAYGEADEYGISPKSILAQIEDPDNGIFAAYTRDPSASRVAGRDIYDEGIKDPLTAHRLKSAIMQIGYKAGDPRMAAEAVPRQAAAAIFGKAHNLVVDDLLKGLKNKTAAKPLPVPRLRTDEQRAFWQPAEDIPVLEAGADQPTTFKLFHDAAAGPTDAYIAQQRMLAGEQPVDMEALKAAILKDDILRDQFMAEYAKVVREAPRLQQQRKPAVRAPTEGVDDYVRGIGTAIRSEMRGEPGAWVSAQTFNDADVNTQIALNAYLRDQVGPWLDVFSKYKASTDRLQNTHAAARALDKTMSPWYKVEAALHRAEARAANKNHFPKLSSPLTLGGGLVGAGAGAWNADDSSTAKDIVNDALLGVVTGAGAGFAATRGGTPAGAKLVRDLGRGSWAAIGRPLSKEAATAARRTAPVTATGNVSDIINEAVRDLLKDKRNDGVVPADSNRLADKRKKGADK